MKRIVALLLAMVMVLGLVACGGGGGNGDTPNQEPTTTPSEPSEPGDTPPAEPGAFVPVTYEWDVLYDNAFGPFWEGLQDGLAAVDLDERLVKMAYAESKLLASGAFVPYTGIGGNYAINRVVPYTTASVDWGNDTNRFESVLFLTDSYVSTEERAVLKEKWNELKGTGTYWEWAKNYMLEQGHTLGTDYASTYGGDPTTWDCMARWDSNDSLFVCRTLDKLVKYDCENVMQPALAESWEVNEDSSKFTFHIRPGVKWVDSQGREVGEVQADDWVASLQHVADCGGGQEELFCGVIAGYLNYVDGSDPDFTHVGVKALDKYTLEYTLEKPFSVFLTMLTYDGIAAPLCRSYYESQGGKFGAEFDPASSSYTYGSSPNNIACCGPFLITSWTEKNSMVFKPNPAYWDPDSIKINSATLYFISGSDPLQSYNMAQKGEIVGASLNANSLEQAKKDGVFDDYHFQTRLNSTTFGNFWCLARLGFANFNDANRMVSPQSHESADSIDLGAGVYTSDILDDAARAHSAVNNANFRLAVNMAFDRGAVQAQGNGEELKYASLRNSYVPATFSSLTKDMTVTLYDGTSVTFPSGAWYGEMLQSFLDDAGVPVKVWNTEIDGGSSDGYDGWYSPENAMAYLNKAIEELAAQGVEVTKENPILLDVPTNSGDPSSYNQMVAFQQSLEASLQGYVKLNLILGDNYDDINNTGYYTEKGEEINYDYGVTVTGWTPDYGDAGCYLETMAKYTGRMTKPFGFWG